MNSCELPGSRPGTLAGMSARGSDLAWLRLRARLLDAIDAQLTYAPTVSTRNRKPMQADKKPFIAPWELRLDDMRVYYDVEEEPEPLVVISAVAVKSHERLLFGGKEIES